MTKNISVWTYPSDMLELSLMLTFPQHVQTQSTDSNKCCYNAEIFFYKSCWSKAGFCNLKSSNVLVSSFCYIWIGLPTLWIYGQYNFSILSVRGQSLDVRIWRLKTVPALKGLIVTATFPTCTRNVGPKLTQQIVKRSLWSMRDKQMTIFRRTKTTT